MTGDEIKEILMKAAIYRRVPAADTAFRLASDGLSDGR